MDQEQYPAQRDPAGCGGAVQDEDQDRDRAASFMAMRPLRHQREATRTRGGPLLRATPTQDEEDLLLGQMTVESLSALLEALGRQIAEITLQAPQASQSSLHADAETHDDPGNELRIDFSDGTSVLLRDDAVLESNRRWMSTDEDLQSFQGAWLLGAQVKSSGLDTFEQFLVVRTDRGSFTLVNHNDHDGHYVGFAITASGLNADGAGDLDLSRAIAESEDYGAAVGAAARALHVLDLAMSRREQGYIGDHALEHCKRICTGFGLVHLAACAGCTLDFNPAINPEDMGSVPRLAHRFPTLDRAPVATEPGLTLRLCSASTNPDFMDAMSAWGARRPWPNPQCYWMAVDDALGLLCHRFVVETRWQQLIPERVLDLLAVEGTAAEFERPRAG